MAVRPLQMRPSPPMDNGSYSFVNHPVLSGILSKKTSSWIGRPFLSKLYDLLLGQSGRRAFFTGKVAFWRYPLPCSAFTNAVRHILSVATDRQMLRIYAGRVVATMQNTLIQGVNPSKDIESQAVSRKVSLPIAPSYSESPVAHSGFARNPQPTITARFNLGEETLLVLIGQLWDWLHHNHYNNFLAKEVSP